MWYYIKESLRIFVLYEGKGDEMNEQTKTMTQETQNREDFIMLPTVDFCFKELMQNAKVRQGKL